MSITLHFDSLNDLQKFLSRYEVSINAGQKRGRKPAAGKVTATKMGKTVKASKLTKTSATGTVRRGRPPKNVAAVATPAKRGPKPKTAAAPKAGKKAVVKATKATVAKKPAKPVVRRPRGEGSLTFKINTAIEQFIGNKKAFSANDVYSSLATSDKTINKQSVVTAVQKQMKTKYAGIRVEDRPGNGPRPVKMFMP